MAGKPGIRFSKLNAERHRERIGDPVPVKPKHNSGMSEAESVRTEELTIILNSWFRRQTDHDSLHNLADKVGMDESYIRRMLQGKTKYTALTLADKILTAIDRPDALSNGEVTVIPNPQWTMEKYIAYMESRGCI